MPNNSFNLNNCDPTCSCHEFTAICRTTRNYYNLTVCPDPDTSNCYKLFKTKLEGDSSDECDIEGFLWT